MDYWAGENLPFLFNTTCKAAVIAYNISTDYLYKKSLCRYTHHYRATFIMSQKGRKEQKMSLRTGGNARSQAYSY